MIVNYRSEESIAREVFKNLSWEEFDLIGTIPTSHDMMEFHHSVGRYIRNHYKLWERGYIPVIVNGVDVAEDHPDAISSRILERVWELVHAF